MTLSCCLELIRMWVDRCVESTGGEQTRGRCALHCLGRVRGDEGGWAWCSLWVVMLMRMQDALGKSSPGSGPCILEGLTFPVTTFTKGQGILVPQGYVYTSPMTPFLCHTSGTWEPAILCSNVSKPAYSLCITSTPVHLLKSGVHHWQACKDLGLGAGCLCV